MTVVVQSRYVAPSTDDDIDFFRWLLKYMLKINLILFMIIVSLHILFFNFLRKSITLFEYGLLLIAFILSIYHSKTQGTSLQNIKDMSFLTKLTLTLEAFLISYTFTMILHVIFCHLLYKCKDPFIYPLLWPVFYMRL